MYRKRTRKKSARTEWLYLLKIILGTTLLMMFNTYLIGKIVQVNMKDQGGIMMNAQIYQFCQIFFGFLFVILQFWFYDRIKDGNWIRESGG